MSSVQNPGALIGKGRSADVFEHGDGKVLRRYREARDTAREVAAMQYARERGYPVPDAATLSGTDIVMDRLEGPTMLADLARRPWAIERHAATLASLQQRLHDIPGPQWLPAPLGPGDALLHLDLHPDNVMLTRDGPVVIDWPNAARGPAAADVAHTWLVLACARAPGGLYERALSWVGRRAFLALFLKRFERAEITAELSNAGAYRLANRTLPGAELEAVAKLLERRG